MPLISLAMIVKNEEATLAHCLGSAGPLADEIVVLDTGSTDGTIEIAKSFGAKVHHFQWCDDFSAARNESLKHCTGEWVLVLDADEAIDPLDYQKIKDACQNPYADAYMLIHRHYVPRSDFMLMGSGTVPNTSSYAEGKNIPFYSDETALRLARRFSGLAFARRVHEQLTESLLSNGKSIQSLNAVLHHYGKFFSDKEKSKATYYFVLAKEEADENPSNGQALFSLMQEALREEEWELALRTAQAYIDNIDNDGKVDPFALFGKGMALKNLGRYEEAIAAFDFLLKREPGHILAMLDKSAAHAAMGDIDSARRQLLKLIEAEPACVPAYKSLAAVECGQEDYGAARKITLKALNIAPSEPSLHGLLVDIELLSENHRQAAEAAMQALRKCPQGGESDKWRKYIALYYGQMAGAELGRGNLDEAQRMAAEVMGVAPDEPAPYDILMRAALAKGGQQQAARHALNGIENCPNGGGGVWHRLAFVHFLREGDIEAAKSILGQGLKAFPNDQELIRLKGLAGS